LLSQAGGLPDVLQLLLGVAEHLPNLDDVASTKGQYLGEKFAAMIVECLTSSKSETRSAASSLLDICIEHGVVSLESVRKATERLKPANQRTIGPMIAKFSRNTPITRQGGKENLPTRESSTTAKPRTTRAAATTEPAQRTAPPAAPAHSASQSNNDHVPTTEAFKHPLIGRGGSQGLRSSKTLVWPEFPEEPYGSEIFVNLKKYWGAVLPPKTVSALFPSSGAKKQDDVMDGIQILSLALEIDRSSDNPMIEQQLDPIQKWISYVLCSKEVTVGLQALLSLTTDLFTLLVDRGRELSDSDAIVLIPFILEKASVSKGRFRDSFMEIASLVQSESLLPPKRLGSVCASMIERSAHAKARVMACQISVTCVEKAGLTGVGKKGLTSTAKMLSEETIPENRAAALELMELILSKMNGDIQRLSRICGPSLSDKARDMVEERWQKRGPIQNQPETSTGPPRDSTAARPEPNLSRDDPSGRATNQSVLYDELPALSLRPVRKETSSRFRETDQTISDDPFAFSLKAQSSVSNAGGDSQEISSKESVDSISDTGSSQGGSFGAAATLRARLLKIREKSQVPEEGDAQATLATVDYDLQELAPVSIVSSEEEFNGGLASIKDLVRKRTPLIEEDVDLMACIETLKKFHAALSKLQKASFGLSAAQFLGLRQLIAENLNETIEHLTRYEQSHVLLYSTTAVLILHLLCCLVD
jgi:cytoskeleton-associated protein 5